MLPEDNRLRQSPDFAFARQHGKHWRNKMFILNAVPNSRLASRYGFVIGRKFGSAVKRNRIKRQLRAMIARWMPSIAHGYDVVMVVRVQASGHSFAELESHLKLLMLEAGLLHHQEGGTL